MFKVFKTVVEVVTATYVGIVIVGTIYELGKDAGRKEALEEIEENSKNNVAEENENHITFNGRRYAVVSE